MVEVALQRRSTLITGVSSGIGFALAARYLDAGWRVYGLARRPPPSLLSHPDFHFAACDVQDYASLEALLRGRFACQKCAPFTTVYLNAGVSGDVPNHAIAVSNDEIHRVLSVNVLSNKAILDSLLGLQSPPRQIVASASIAGLRFRPGMLPYSLSKAALVALIGTYAEEYPSVFFLALGMCNVDTAFSRSIIDNPRVSEFPAHQALRERFAQPGYAVSAEHRAGQIYDLMTSKDIISIKSGAFREIRDLLSDKLRM